MPAIGNTDELVAAIGYTAFETLVSVRGGRRLYVPTDVESAAQIVQWLGEEKAHRLIEEFGGFAIDIPNRRPTTLPSRQQVIEALISARLSDADIADKVGCTERWVRNIRSQMREALPGSNRRAAS
jgi:DNA-binding NarL/FixJ family response regulator